MFGSMKNHLKESLLLLPEPILIVGNRIPDGDSLGSAVAILDFYREEGIEAYIHCVESPSIELAWMLEDEDENALILEDYLGLVVVDDCVDANRLGVLIKENVPTICIDHHITNKPDEKEGWETIQDYDLDMLIGFKGNQVKYWKLSQAAACLLIDYGLCHPYLWVSLYTDSVGLTKNGISTAGYITKLVNSLKDSFNMTLTDVFQEEMYNKINIKGSLKAFRSLIGGTMSAWSGIDLTTGQKVQIIIAAIDVEDTSGFRKILGTLKQFSDISCIVNRSNGKCSLRSEIDSIDMTELAKRFGGGGHKRAAGFSVDTKNILETLDLVQEYFSTKFDLTLGYIYE